MEEYHAGYVKYFVKLPLQCAQLEKLCRSVLQDRKSGHALHLTLTTLYLTKDSAIDGTLRRVQTALQEHGPQLMDAMALPAQVVTTNPQYKAMGYDRVKSFALCFSGPSGDLRTALCNLLAQELSLQSRQCTIGDRQYTELYRNGHDRNTLVRVPVAAQDDAVQCHVSLFSTIDLQRCNKTLYGEWKKTEPEKFVARLFGEPTELTLTYTTVEMSAAKVG